MNKNRFAALDDDPAPAEQKRPQTQQAAKPKVVQRQVFGAPREEGKPERRDRREGGEGGQRGRGRGGERGRGRGEFRGGRGGDRGRGGRGRRNEGEGGEVVEFTRKGDGEVSTRGRGKSHRHEGGEGKHGGFDRKSGTGRGKDVRKDGHGKGNWGKKDEAEPKADDAEKKEEGEGEATEEKKEVAPAEPKPETEHEIARRKIQEEEAKVKTLDDYLSSRKVAGIKAQAREADKINVKNIESKEELVNTRQTTIQGKLTDAMTYSAGYQKTEEASLLAFQAGVEEDFGGDRPRGRGGRGGRGRGDRPEGGRKQGGRGGKLKVNEEEFPAL